MKELWNTAQLIFAAIDGWLGFFLGGCDGLLNRNGRTPLKNVECFLISKPYLWSYELLELVEARTKHGSTIFCTQYDPAEWYPRLSPDQDSPIADAIMDRIVHNAHVVAIEGNVSMRERHGLSATEANLT